MNYFGKKSLSSVTSAVLHVSWYVVLVGAIIAVVIALLTWFYKPVSDPIISGIEQGISNMATKDKLDWEEFKNWPVVFQLILIPYFGVFVVLLLKIIKKSQLLFANFKNDIVFDKSNALIISKISKLNIVFSIISFNFSLLLVSVLLFILCEIFKKGSVLQEEHDLTV